MDHIGISGGGEGGVVSPAQPSSPERRYKGVRLRKWGRWVSEIRMPNSRERIWLGSYESAEKAARAFDAAAVCLRGSRAPARSTSRSPPLPTSAAASPARLSRSSRSRPRRRGTPTARFRRTPPPPAGRRRRTRSRSGKKQQPLRGRRATTTRPCRQCPPPTAALPTTTAVMMSLTGHSWTRCRRCRRQRLVPMPIWSRPWMISCTGSCTQCRHRHAKTVGRMWWSTAIATWIRHFSQ